MSVMALEVHRALKFEHMCAGNVVAPYPLHAVSPCPSVSYAFPIPQLHSLRMLRVLISQTCAAQLQEVKRSPAYLHILSPKCLRCAHGRPGLC